MSEKEIKISFNKDEQFLKTVFWRGLIDTAVIFLIVMAVISGFGIVCLLTTLSKLVGWVMFTIGIVQAAAVIIAVYFIRLSKLKAEIEKIRVAPEPVTAVFDNEKISVSGIEKESISNTIILYKEIYKLQAKENYLFFYTGKYDFFTFKTNGLSEKEIEMLKRLPIKSN